MTAPESHPGPRVLGADEVAVPRSTIALMREVATDTTWAAHHQSHAMKQARRLLALLDEVTP